MSNIKGMEADIALAVSPIKRRAFLRNAISLGAGLAVFGVSGCDSEAASAGGEGSLGLSFLRSTDIPLIEKLIEALLPADDGLLAPADSESVLKNMDAFVGAMSAELRSDVNLLFSIFNMSSVLLSGRFSKFQNLRKHDAVRYLERWQDGVMAQRAIVTALKKFIYLSYWRQENTWPAIGYDGPVSTKWKLPSLGNAPTPK